MLPQNHITIISFDKTIEDIANFEELPKPIKMELKGAHLYSRGFQEILGYNDERTIILSCGGHWISEGPKKDLFTVLNYGSKRFQWDGQVLKSIHFIYQSRYVAFAASKGLTPEELEGSTKTNIEFIEWISDKWNKFYKSHPQFNKKYPNKEVHNAFDSWLWEA